MAPKKKKPPPIKAPIVITRKTRSQLRKRPSKGRDKVQNEADSKQGVSSTRKDKTQHKKFGKFRCLDKGKEVENEDKMEVIETVDDASDLCEKLVELDVSEAEEPEEIMECAPDVEPVVECIAEEIICGEVIFEGEECVIIEDYVEESIIEENATPIESAEEECDKKSQENQKEIEVKPKPTINDKIIPSRKSKRISLKAANRLNKFQEIIITKEKPKESASDLEESSSGHKSDESSGSSNSSKESVKKVDIQQIEQDMESDDKTTDPTSSSEEVTEDAPDESPENSQDVKVIKKIVKKTNLKSKNVKQVKKKILKKDITKTVKLKPTVKTGKKLKIVPKGKKLVKKKKPDNNEKSADEDENSIRRSSRIKTISNQKKTSRGKGLVKKDTDTSDNSNSGNGDEKPSRESPSFTLPKEESDHKPVKVKSRWRRSSELEMNSAQTKVQSQAIETLTPPITEDSSKLKVVDAEVERRLKQFTHLKENQYLTERISCKEAKKMTCDCFLTDDEISKGEFGCGEDCLNRLLMIECGNLCTVGDRCTNKRFQKGQHAPCDVFRTDKKGLGIQASANIPYGEFILEYVGEVLDPDEFDKRATEYSKDKNQHYYFMSLRADAVIDATQKGNISRFINHSCDPNAETQKWTVNGELRIGFFSKKTILAGEEITFDYQFQRYGKEAQKCFCEAATCRGWLGEEPEDDDDDDEEEEEEEEEDEEEEEEEEEKDEVIKIIVDKPAEEIMEPIVVQVNEKIEIVVPDTEIVTEGIVIEKESLKKEKSPKKEKKAKVIKRKTRKELFEDLDLDDEIATLQTTGLKNQVHTLKLSRLMVRAKESGQRMKLLKLLKRGELPCRRLFLDYHGLRLIHGWMTDTQQQNKQDEETMNCLRLDILQTLAMLPIPNKTMLQDSKVLPTVEKWSISEKPAVSPNESESNSPKLENEISQTSEQIKEDEIKQEETEEDFEIRRSVGMDVTHKRIHKEINTIEELSKIFDDDMEISPITDEDKDSNLEIKEEPQGKTTTVKNIYDVVEEILALATKLLEEWAILKEVFRIPKKERIEQMKEHEREADKRYKAISLEQESIDKKRDRYRDRNVPRCKDDRCRKGDRNMQHYPRISKHERRKMFAMKVEQAEADRRRKQQEFWNQHVKNCMMIGTDPRFTAPFDPSRGYQCIWNPQIGQWQNYPIPEQNMMYNQNMPPHPHMANNSFPFIPPGMSLPPTMPSMNMANQAQNIPPPNMPPLNMPSQNMGPQIPPHNMPPQNLPHNIPPQNLPHIMPPQNLPHNMPQQNLPHNMPQQNLPSHNMPPQSPHNMTPQNLAPHNMPPQNMTPHNMLPPSIPPPNLNQQNIPMTMSQNIPSHTMQPQNISQNIPHMSPQSINVPPPRGMPQNLVPPNIPPPSLPPLTMSSQNITTHIIPQQNLGPRTPPEQKNLSIQHNMPTVNKMVTKSNPPPMPHALLPPNITQPIMPAASMGSMPPMPNIPPVPSLPYKGEKEDLTKVKFMGPIPPPAKLPLKWKCAKDKYGRPYYYHIKLRKSQWEPPEYVPIVLEEIVSESESSSSDTSSLSSDSSSDDSDSDDIDDTRLMLEIRNKFKRMEAQKKFEHLKKEENKTSFGSPTNRRDIRALTDVDDSVLQETSLMIDNSILEESLTEDAEENSPVQDPIEQTLSSLDRRLIEELGFLKEEPPQKRRRLGLVQEILISPRTEEDRLQFREDVKRYKQNKEKLRKEKEIIMLQNKKQIKTENTSSSSSNTAAGSSTSGTTAEKISKVPKKKISVRTKLKELELNSEASKKIKETFRSDMASVMVAILNAYRKTDCKDGRITNTDDFKHLARKLTHFVMLKELKHSQKIEDLTVTESVKVKAREFVRKYMSKFGEVYQRPADELDNF